MAVRWVAKHINTRDASHAHGLLFRRTICVRPAFVCRIYRADVCGGNGGRSQMVSSTHDCLARASVYKRQCGCCNHALNYGRERTIRKTQSDVRKRRDANPTSRSTVPLRCDRVTDRIPKALDQIQPSQQLLAVSLSTCAASLLARKFLEHIVSSWGIDINRQRGLCVRNSGTIWWHRQCAWKVC